MFASRPHKCVYFMSGLLQSFQNVTAYKASTSGDKNFHSTGNLRQLLLCLQVTNQLYKKILYSMSELMSMINRLSDRSPGAALLLELNRTL